MKSKRVFQVILVLLLLFGAEGILADDCDAVLDDSFNTEFFFTDSQALSAYYNWACSRATGSRSRSAGLNFLFKGFGVGGSGKVLDSWGRASCSQAKSLDAQQTIIFQLTRTRDLGSIRAWSECKARQRRLHCFARPNPDLSNVAFEVSWQHPGQAKVKSASLRNADSSNEFYEGQELKFGSHTISAFRADVSQPAIFTLNVETSDEVFSCTAFVPPRLEPPKRGTIRIEARNFSRSENVEVSRIPQYGNSVILNAPPYNERPNGVVYDFNVPVGGDYEIYVEYAARDPRPVEVSVNNRVINRRGLALTTGGWEERFQRWEPQGSALLYFGENVLILQRESVFPHIRAIEFRPIAR